MFVTTVLMSFPYDYFIILYHREQPLPCKISGGRQKVMNEIKILLHATVCKILVVFPLMKKIVLL